MIYKFAALASALLAFTQPCLAFAQNRLAPSPENAGSQFTANFVFYTGSERQRAPFQIKNGLIVLKVRINGEDAWAILDSGAGNTVLDRSFAEQRNLLTDRSLEPVDTSSGRVTRVQTQSLLVDIPGVVKVTSPVSAVDLSKISEVIGIPVSLVIGAEYFAKTAVVISFKYQKLDIGPASGLKMEGPNFTGASISGDQEFYIDTLVNGVSMPLKIDTGYNNDIGLTDDQWAAAVTGEASGKMLGTMGVDGRLRTTASVDGQTAQIGSSTFADVSLVRSRGNSGSPGILGLGILRRFDHVVFDASRAKIWFSVPAPSAPELDGR